jgi:hypothetical protein
MTIDIESSINQKQGGLKKCPSCGGVLKAFVSTCDLCGHELVGIAANKTLTDLFQRFDNIEDEVDRIGLTGGKRTAEINIRKSRIIRDFAIPNSRDDLQSLIYFIHPKIQNNIKPDTNAEDWRVKFREVMTLAKNAYKGDSKTRLLLEEIEQSVNTTISEDLQIRAKRNPLISIAIGMTLLAAAIGVISTQIEKLTQSQCEAKFEQQAGTEKIRLEKIVTDILEMKKAENYTGALNAANQIVWQYKESCKLEDAKREQGVWDSKRKELIAQIQQNELLDVSRKKEDKAIEKSERQDESAKKSAIERKISASKEW